MATPFQIAKASAKALVDFFRLGRGEDRASTVARGLVTPGGIVTELAKPEALAAAKTLDVLDSGRTFYLDLAGGFTVTLPAGSLARIGMRFKFVAKTAPTTAYIIAAATADADKIRGHVLSSSGGAEDTESTGGDVVNFVANTAVIGDMLEVEWDGVQWLASARCAAAGGITITG